MTPCVCVCVCVCVREREREREREGIPRACVFISPTTPSCLIVILDFYIINHFYIIINISIRNGRKPKYSILLLSTYHLLIRRLTCKGFSEILKNF